MNEPDDAIARALKLAHARKETMWVIRDLRFGYYLTVPESKRVDALRQSSDLVIYGIAGPGRNEFFRIGD